MDRLKRFFDFAPYLVFIIFLIFSIFLYNLSVQTLNNEISNTYRITTRELANDVESRMKMYEQILRGGEGLYVSNEYNVSRDMWHEYIERLELSKNYPGIQAIGFAKIVKDTEAKQHITEMRASGIKDYTVRPSIDKKRMAVVTVMYPETKENLRVLGFDLSSETVRAAMFNYAEQSRSTGISGKLVLKQETDKETAPAGILMARPMFRDGELYGFIAAPFRMNRLMQGIFGDNTKGVALTVYDSEVKDENIMFSSKNNVISDEKYTCIIPLDIYGRIWMLKFTAQQEFINQFDHNKPVIILLGGLVTGTLLAMLIFILLKTRTRAYEIAEQMSQKFYESEDRYRRTFEQVAVGIIMTSLDGNILKTNQFFKDITGYTEGECKKLSFFDMMDPECISDMENVLSWLIDRKIENYDAEKLLTVKNGTKFWANITLSAFFDKNGVPLYLILVVEDISKRKKAEEMLLKLNMGLENKVTDETRRRVEQERILMQQSRLAAMGEMIGAIAHQWRQPLNILALMIQNVKDDFLEKSLTEEVMMDFTDSSIEQLQYMSCTIDDFRNFFKTDKDSAIFSPYIQVENVNKLMHAQLESASISLFITEKGQGLVRGIANEFSQVVLNLINNSKDAFQQNNTEKPFIDIDVTSKENTIEVIIRDNAGGIPEEIADKIFDPYFTTKGPDKGTGIGLYMSKIIIHDHFNGNLSFRNIENGTEFTIILPKSADAI